MHAHAASLRYTSAAEPHRLAYEYVLKGDVPPIEGRAGDVLVWAWPRVGLVRAGEDPRVLDGHPAFWWWLFEEYGSALTPREAPRQPLAALLPLPSSPETRGSAASARPAAARSLRLLP